MGEPYVSPQAAASPDFSNQFPKHQPPFSQHAITITRHADFALTRLF
jgi:hypothetical protein